MSWAIDRADFDEAVRDLRFDWIWSVIEWAQAHGGDQKCPVCGSLAPRLHDARTEPRGGG
jgi:hypothetical protein